VEERERPSLKNALLVGLGGLAIVGLALYIDRSQRPETLEIVAPEPTLAPTAAPLIVHVSGAVLRPGVYSLPAGARWEAAIAAAGGLTDDAQVDVLNLAAPVADGQRVHIPAIGETPPTDLAPAAAAESGAVVRINHATAAQLEALPCVGPAIAQRIIDYREVNGPLQSLAALDQVKGIGPACLAELEPLVRFD